MSLNDRNLGVASGVDMHDGVANPTASSNNSNPLDSNFVTDPTSANRGAGAGPNFDGHLQAARGFKETAGVVEGRPGVIETANIDPLNQNSNKDDGWANATKTPGSGSTGGFTSNVTSSAVGTAKEAVGVVKEVVFGK